jgi:teneurin
LAFFLVACKSPNCSNNGVCIDGKCMCFNNYTGVDCSQQLTPLASVCSNHGEFDYATKSCQCYASWQEPDCSVHENCADKRCTQCKSGWSGDRCMTRVPHACDPRCAQHGICVNGTCNCSPGYQGRHCSISEFIRAFRAAIFNFKTIYIEFLFNLFLFLFLIDNCPNLCSMNGICERVSGKYQCICNPGWTGRACDIAIEMICNDDIDNDKGRLDRLHFFL